MKIVIGANKNGIMPDWGFMLYFIGMFCFYQYTYFQLAIQIFIIGYVILSKILQSTNSSVIRAKVSKVDVKNVLFFLLWFGILLAIMAISAKTYRIYYSAASRTLLTTFRIFIIGVIIFYYADTKEKALSVVESMVIGAFAMSVVVLLVTPPSAYFSDSNTDGFGSLISQHRNQVGAACATMFMPSYYLRKHAKFNGGYLFCIVFIIVALISGSRGSILQLGIEITLIMIINGNFIGIFFLALFGLLTVVMLKNVPALYENIWLRFASAADTIVNSTTSDGSTLSRQYYKEIAWQMFLRHPFVGYGVDGFKGYVFFHPVYKGQILRAVYSHCNFSELMSCFGIVGLAGWYIPTFTMLVKSLKGAKYSPYLQMTSIALFAMIILDYARIPWASHLGTYMYFAMFIVILNFSRYVNEQKPAKTKIDKIDTENFIYIPKNKPKSENEEVNFTIVSK